MLNRQTVSDVASQLGEPEQAVSRGLETSLATVVTGVGNKVKEPGAMRQIFDLVQGAPSGAMDLSSLAAGSTAAGGSSLLNMGSRLLSTLFGGSQNIVASALGRNAGVSEGSASRLLGMAAPLVLGALGQRVSSERLSADGFASMVQRESSGIKSMLPSGLGDVLNRVTGVTGVTAPAAHVTSEPARSSRRWLWPILAGCAALIALLLLFNRGRTPRVTAPDLPGTAERAADRVAGTAAGLGDFVRQKLPGNVDLKIPQNGVEARLLSFVQDSSRGPDRDTWFDFDRVSFATGSATLTPESQEQLKNVASILKAYPNVRLKIGGYTDNTGDPSQNRKLSQDRASAVVAQLTAMGISPDRLQAEGYGDQHPVADNSTEEGRARNRRISMQVTQK
jgi:outer membrane protein OmpA-like peptidoglycan-associated protein